MRFVLFGCIFATNAPDTPHWTLKLRFGAFHTIWVHSGPFDCLTKLGAKRAELVQKIVSQSRGGFFRNEGTRSTPCDPKLTFWCVRTIWVQSGQFGCLTKLDDKWAEQVQKFVPRSRVGIFRNKSPRSNPLDPKLMFWCVFILFGCIRDHLVALRNSVQNGPN